MTFRNQLRLHEAQRHLSLAESAQQEVARIQQDIRRCRQKAISCLQDVLLSLDIECATQTAEWQEGDLGWQNVRESAVLRERIAALEQTGGEARR